MAWKTTPKKNNALAYISKKSSEDEAAQPLANGMLKAISKVMHDLKAKNLLFTVTDMTGTKSVCKAVVKVTPSLDYQNGTEIFVNGTKIMNYPAIKDDSGNQVYNVSATIYHGTQTLTIFGGKHLNDDGTIPLTSIRWGNYNHNDPKNSESAKGIQEIENSNASPELKAVARELEISGYIRDYDVTFSKKIDNYTIASAMKSTIKPLVKLLKDQKAMPLLISKSGLEYYGNAYIEVQEKPDKTGYYVRAGIRKDDETLYINAGTKIHADNTVSLYGVSYQKYNSVCPSDSIRVPHDEILTSDSVPADFKKLARAIIDSGYLILNTEMREYAYTLNTEYFKNTVQVKNDQNETVTKKECNASYKPSEPKKDGNGNWPESITIFNRIEPEIMVVLTDSDMYGRAAKVINTALTEDEEGLHTRENGDPAAYGYIESAGDLTEYLPDSKELRAAVADWLGLVIQTTDNLDYVTVDLADTEELPF